MRETLRCLAAAEGSLKLSLTRGRVGWLATSPLPLELLRQRAHGFCRRVVLLHSGAEMSRYYLEPDWRRLGRCLEVTAPRAASLSCCPRRRERLRRLGLYLPALGVGPLDPRSHNELFRRMSLRLEALSHESTNQQALNRHLEEDFDRLWRDVPLFAVRLTKFQKIVLRSLVSSCMDIKICERQHKSARQGE